MATLQPSLAQQVASGAVRNLTMTTKVSRPVLSTILQNASAFPPPILQGISQAGGGTLYDLNGFPVYYEVAMDKVQYDTSMTISSITPIGKPSLHGPT
jgi:hypothetical protein